MYLRIRKTLLCNSGNVMHELKKIDDFGCLTAMLPMIVEGAVTTPAIQDSMLTKKRITREAN
jgi:hypothetical protein